jgi:ubiquinone/menaquinone biosynthesis C-methylase UbiE
MAADFDHTAHNYDQDFTSSPIGKVQRDLVFKSLESCFLISNQTKVLEINCGTGEDALHFGELGANVLATDISEKMVNVARQKTADLDNVSCQVLDINALAEFEPDKKFDLIFSNFGGLNCLSETELLSFFKNATQKLEKDGVLALVIMPNFCLWETFYFSSKLQFSKAFRRRSKQGVMANVDGQEVKTYYYSPSQIKEFATQFAVLKTAPIGFYTPPSYLNDFFQNRPKTIKKLAKRDENRLNRAYLASFSDHFLICLQKI